MWPTIISIGSVAVHSYGLMLGLGVFFGGFILWLKGREEGFDEEKLMDSWIIAGLTAFIFGRIGFIILHFNQFGSSWYKWLFITKYPGLSYFGALVGVVAGLSYMVKKYKWQWWSFFEMAVFALLLVEIFGWFGAFLGGSINGRETGFWWGLKFPGTESRQHPVSLIFLIGLIFLWHILKKWEKRYRTFKWYQQKKEEAEEGFIVAAYLIGLGLMRFLIEFLIKAEISWGGIGVNQWWALIMMIIGGLILVFRSGIKVKLAELGENRQMPINRSDKIKQNRKPKTFDYK